jgi:hypothetical protein
MNFLGQALSDPLAHIPPKNPEAKAGSNGRMNWHVACCKMHNVRAMGIDRRRVRAAGSVGYATTFRG